MYPDSGTSRRRNRAKSPLPLLLLRHIRPGASHHEDYFGAPGNLQMVQNSTKFFSRETFLKRAYIPPLITHAVDGESNRAWTPKIYTCLISSNSLPTTKNTRALSYMHFSVLYGGVYTPPAQHLLTPYITQTPVHKPPSHTVPHSHTLEHNKT